MTDLITRDPHDTGEIPGGEGSNRVTARIYLPDPPTETLPLSALPFYDNGRPALRPGEPPIIDNRPAATKLVDRPKTLADTPAPAGLAGVLTAPAAEHPLIPAVTRSRRDGDPGRHRAAAPAWLCWLVGVGGLLVAASAPTLIVLAVIR